MSVQATVVGPGGTLSQGAAGADPWPVADAALTGAWGYVAGVTGTPVLPAGCRVIGIAAIPATGGGTVTVDGGDTVVIPEGFPLDWQPLGQLVAPTLVFSGTQSFVVEVLT